MALLTVFVLTCSSPDALFLFRYVSAGFLRCVTQLPFICPRYRLPLWRRLWSPLLLSCFFLVWSALWKFTLTFTSAFMCVRLLLLFSFFFWVAFRYMRLSFLFSPFEFVRCRFGASNDLVCGSFPYIGNIFLCIAFLTCFYFCLFWSAVPLRP